jgi:DnaJ family protein C protein 9
VYDQTGSLEDSEGLAGEKFEDLYQYYRNIYKKVSEEDIDNVAGEYRGSEEETQDLFKHYRQFKGNMEKVRSTPTLRPYTQNAINLGI